MITKRKRKWGWAGWTGKPNPRAGAWPGKDRLREHAQSCTPLQEGQTGLRGRVGGGDSRRTRRESRKPRRGRHSRAQRTRHVLPDASLLSPNRWQPCDSLKSRISQPPLQILMVPQQMECGKKQLGGASREDLFPRMAELALPFPPSPCLEADVTAGAAIAIL